MRAAKKNRKHIVKPTICIVGNGTWATTIAAVVGGNVRSNPEFTETVYFWVFEEILEDGTKLSDYINKHHINKRYAPEVMLPENVLAVPDLIDAVEEANILIFSIPNYFLSNCIKTLEGNVMQGAYALFLMRDLDRLPKFMGCTIQPFITQNLKLKCSVMTSFNLKSSYLKKQICQLTIGTKDKKFAHICESIFKNEYINITITPDALGLELVVGLTNIVVLAAGFYDGFRKHESQKVLVIRMGIMEIIRFMDLFYPQTSLQTLFLNCGIPELIMKCYGSTTRRLGHIIVNRNIAIPHILKKYFPNITVSGPKFINYIYTSLIKKNRMEDKFPVFQTVYMFLRFREKSFLYNLVYQTTVDVVHPDNMEQI